MTGKSQEERKGSRRRGLYVIENGESRKIEMFCFSEKVRGGENLFELAIYCKSKNKN